MAIAIPVRSRRVVWASSSYIKSRPKADEALQELERIAEDNGDLTPGGVVEASRPPGAVLHGSFEWDNRRAAEKFRLVQAREIIHSLRVVEEKADGHEEETMAYVSIRISGDSKHRSYLPVERVMAVPALASSALEDALMALRSFERRYNHLQELAGVFEEARRVRNRRPRKAKSH